jgi:alanyl-tRNA synthetase
VPRNDPTLMFTNAGMVQFKNVFTGLEKRPYTARHDGAEMRPRRRQAQRPRQCRLHRAPSHLLRDARQFLLRRLFQGAAIELAWNLITKEFGLAKDKLLVTVYSRGRRSRRPLEEDRRPSDEDHPHPDLGQFLGDGRHRPLRSVFGNLHRPWRHIWGGPPGSPDEDGDRFIEIWNLVFMQFDQLATKARACRPAAPVDRHRHGPRAHRAVLQGKHDNYDIDLFRR